MLISQLISVQFIYNGAKSSQGTFHSKVKILHAYMETQQMPLEQALVDG